MSRADELATRRTALQARCAAERLALRRECAAVEVQLGVIERGVRWVASVARHPALVAAGVAGLGLIGPTKLFNWIGKGLLFYKLAQRVGGLFFSRERDAAAHSRDAD